MKPVYVVIDKNTGKFWKPLGYRYSGIRAMYAYVSEAKAWAAIKQMDIDESQMAIIEIKRYTNNETSQYNPRGDNR